MDAFKRQVAIETGVLLINDCTLALFPKIRRGRGELFWCKPLPAVLHAWGLPFNPTTQ